MPKWIDELEDLVKGMSKPCPPAQDDDYDNDDDNDDEGDGGEPFGKSASVKVDKYEPADNGDDDDLPGGPAVRDPDKIDRLTGGKKLKTPAGANAGTGVVKSIRETVDAETVDAINAADALAAIADACDNIFTGFAKSFKQITNRLDAIEAGQAAIGGGISKSLQGTRELLKGIQADVEEVAKQPRGRKGVTKGVERNFVGNQGASAPLNREEVVAKSFKALQKGLITSTEAGSIDVYFNRGKEIPQDLLARINSAD